MHLLNPLPTGQGEYTIQARGELQDISIQVEVPREERATLPSWSFSYALA
jgi:hypothetical protein